MPFPLLRHKTKVLCRKQKLWTQMYDLVLGLDTCLGPEARNWTNLNCEYNQAFGRGLDPIEGSGVK